MSASLVGSEMCIRDSPSPLPSPPGVGKACVENTLRERTAALRNLPPGAETCAARRVRQGPADQSE
eukprot:7670125-Alexandrium_andersonii.AAC.1